MQALAEELECSTRTVQRILQTLSAAGVPFRYDAELRAYRVPDGFKFPGLEATKSNGNNQPDLAKIRDASKQLLHDGERFLDSLRLFCDQLGD